MKLCHVSQAPLPQFNLYNLISIIISPTLNLCFGNRPFSFRTSQVTEFADPNRNPKTERRNVKRRSTLSAVVSAMGKASPATIHSLNFYLSEHPAIVGFRWSHTQSWGNTWSFLFTSIAAYLLLSLFLHLSLTLLLRRARPVPLGPIPAIHSLSMSLISVTIFAGILLSAAAEIRETRWFWRRSKTPFQWLLCFPLGTRPSGRVFFWSYVFYLSRFFHMLRTVFTVLRRRKLSFYQLFNHSISTFMSFLWLEFSQSFQVLAILFTTLVYSVVYGYRFWTAIGLRSACFPFVLNCQIVLLGCNLVCHVGVFLLHFFFKGGCNGIGAWVFNSVLNAAILSLFLNFYVRMYFGKRRELGGVVGDQGESKAHSCSVFSAERESDMQKLKFN